MEKRSKIDWAAIKITIVTADKNHPNELNPYSRLSPRERERVIVSASAKIWVRHIRAKLSEKNNSAAQAKIIEPEPTLPPASTPAEVD